MCENGKLLKLRGGEVEVSSKQRNKKANAFRSGPVNHNPVHNSDLCLSGAKLTKSIAIVNTRKKLNPAHDYSQGLICPIMQ